MKWKLFRRKEHSSDEDESEEDVGEAEEECPGDRGSQESCESVDIDPSLPLYSPLDENEIRLIRRIRHDTYILKKATINDKYHCMSYVWGDSSITEPIEVNGRKVNVTVNLASALRRQEDGIWLWADALCINQADLQERNRQVAIMADIYRKAQGVRAWIEYEGGDAYDLQFGLALLCRDSYVPTASAFSQTTNAFKEVGRLFENRFWQRIWILQELVLAKEVCIFYGALRMLVTPWSRMLESALGIVDTNISVQMMREDSLVYRLLSSRKRFASNADMKEVSAALERADRVLIRITEAQCGQWTPGGQATRKHDYVYGILGLIKMDIIPDYSLPVEEVYADFAYKMMVDEQSLNWLMSSAFSWAPDLANEEEPPLAVSQYEAASNADFFLERHGLDLMVPAMIFDEVKVIPSQQDLSLYDGTQERLRTLLCDVHMAANAYGMGQIAESIFDIEEDHKMFKQELKKVTKKGIKHGGVAARINRNLAKMDFFITAHERQGMAKKTMRSGDKVCLIATCSAPFIIRPHQHGYKIVSVCYVNGIMHNEPNDGLADSKTSSPLAFENLTLAWDEGRPVT